MTQTTQQETRRKSVGDADIHYQPLLLASVPPEELDQDDAFFDTRLPSSVRRRVPPTPAQAHTIIRVTKHHGLPLMPTLRASRTTTHTPQARQHAKQAVRRFHWLFYVGGSMVAGVALWIVGNTAITLGQTVYDNLTYGTPRTFQVNANVGHQGISHFIAQNLNGDIVVIEENPSNLAQSHIYQGPVFSGPGADEYVATLTFKDVNGDGKPDMVIAVDNQRFILVNTGSAFRPSTLADHINPEVN